MKDSMDDLSFIVSSYMERKEALEKAKLMERQIIIRCLEIDATDLIAVKWDRIKRMVGENK
jgi:hypothetical protein